MLVINILFSVVAKITGPRYIISVSFMFSLVCRCVALTSFLSRHQIRVVNLYMRMYYKWIL